MRKLLLITFPVDFGSHTLAQTYVRWLTPRANLKVFSFSPKEKSTHTIKYASRIFQRISSSFALNIAIISARLEGRTILIQQVSPALFGLPSLAFSDSFIMLDWTRRIYEPIIGEKSSSTLLTAFHSITFRSVRGVIAFTEAAKSSLEHQYGLAARQIYRMPLPYDVERVQRSVSIGSPLRIVFVGGDFARKGGKLLADWSKTVPPHLFELTFITQSKDAYPGRGRIVRNETGVSAVTLLRDYDIFALPTKFDAFPVALGEAAAAGLALLTTTNALGHTEVVLSGENGYAAASDGDFIQKLNSMINDSELVSRFKAKSRNLMEEKFTFDICFAHLERIISAK